MTLTPTSADYTLITEAIRLAKLRDQEGATTFERFRGRPILELTEAFQTVGRALRNYLEGLSDRDLTFVYAIWNTGHRPEVGNPSLKDYSVPEYEGWRQAVYRSLTGSTYLVKDLITGARKMKAD